MQMHFIQAQTPNLGTPECKCMLRARFKIARATPGRDLHLERARRAARAGISARDTYESESFEHCQHNARSSAEVVALERVEQRLISLRPLLWRSGCGGRAQWAWNRRSWVQC